MRVPFEAGEEEGVQVAAHTYEQVVEVVEFEVLGMSMRVATLLCGSFLRVKNLPPSISGSYSESQNTDK